MVVGSHLHLQRYLLCRSPSVDERTGMASGSSVVTFNHLVMCTLATTLLGSNQATVSSNLSVVEMSELSRSEGHTPERSKNHSSLYSISSSGHSCQF